MSDDDRPNVWRLGLTIEERRVLKGEIPPLRARLSGEWRSPLRATAAMGEMDTSSAERLLVRTKSRKVGDAGADPQAILDALWRRRHTIAVPTCAGASVSDVRPTARLLGLAGSSGAALGSSVMPKDSAI